MTSMHGRRLIVGAALNRLAQVFCAVFLVAMTACSTGRVATGGEEDVAMIDYRLGSGDRLRINVFGEATLSGEFVVNSTGAISYPLLGSVPAQGQTVGEFTASLSTAMQRYIRQPSISVEVLNYRPFYILGEVRSPNTYPYTSGLTVLNAVATAGGFSERANTREVFIKHADQVEERRYGLTTTLQVRPGDTVRIPERRF